MKKSIKLTSSNGKTLLFNFVTYDFELAKKFVEKHTGLIYGIGDLYPQTIGTISAFISNHSPNELLTLKFMESAKYIIALGIAEKCGGFTGRINKVEMVVYVPHEKGEYIVNVDEILENIFEGNYNYANCIHSVENIGTKITLDELRTKLMKAIEKENYELAAKLRDRIIKEENKKK